MSMRKIMTAKTTRKLDSELASELSGADVNPADLDSMSEMLLESLDFATAHEMAGSEPPRADPLTGLVLDSAPNLVVERTGLEELDVQEIHRHRYSGQYPGKPGSHYLGGSNDITFGNDGSKISERWDRVKDYIAATRTEKRWREAYHQVGFIADRLDLPNPVREDACRAYANLREQGISKAYSLEGLLGLLTYVACRIHDYPRDFDDVKEAIDELYDLEIEKEDVSKDMVRAFNKGPIRFGIENSNGRQYLRTWKRINGKQVNHRSLGSL